MLKMVEICKSYNKQFVFNNFNLEIDDGKIYLLTGKNGSGKSTLFKMIIGKTKIDNGEIVFSSKKIGYLPERNYLPKMCTAIEYLKLFTNLDIKSIKKICIEFGLSNKSMYKFSKGMKQKVALLSVLLLEKDIYILDEPYDGIDDASKNKLNEIILNLKSKNKTIIISTHEEEYFSSLNCESIKLQ